MELEAEHASSIENWGMELEANMPLVLRTEGWSWRQNMPLVLRTEGWSWRQNMPLVLRTERWSWRQNMPHVYIVRLFSSQLLSLCLLHFRHTFCAMLGIIWCRLVSGNAAPCTCVLWTSVWKLEQVLDIAVWLQQWNNTASQCMIGYIGEMVDSFSIWFVTSVKWLPVLVYDWLQW